MTLDEFIESRSHWCDDAPDGIVSLHIDEMKAIHAEAIRYGAEFSQRWTPVEDELPNESGDYLCIVRLPEVDGFIITIAYFTLDGNWIIYSTGQINEIITVKVVSKWRHITVK